MAPTSVHAPLKEADIQSTKASSIKALTESGSVTSVPSEYSFTLNPNDQADSNDPDHSIPTIDFSLLTSGSPEQRSNFLHDLRKACEDWGFFMVINHGVEESVMKGMIDECEAFFNLTDEEKKEFQGTRNALDPIKCGTSFNVAIDKVLLWRDFIKVISHPEFNSPHKPAGFSEAALEFSKRTREVATELLKAISETLGLESDYIANAMNWDQGLQMVAANYYPACPQPDRAIGIPPHTDHGLVTLLIQNQMGGLQVQHKGKWVNWNAMPNSIVVNLGDQMQVLTNDMYKSVWHRAVVNNTATRISIAVPHGPSVDTVVVPSPELLEREGLPPSYSGISYKDYITLQQSAKSYMKPCLDNLRIHGK
ncbi:Oxoglutarate/iron-dependent dioxygenase [Parasponia andersonii]|uniref:Oxoglutarate/iron-dependent dioxygenase n=1 Tax=Parasponia andersonii TaxID=3476 RepID=A0A2P5A8Z5_PARAD|nr:Oxoglutarate/iron-dependent dioxygenase [Parasponia andersonii]